MGMLYLRLTATLLSLVLMIKKEHQCEAQIKTHKRRSDMTDVNVLNSNNNNQTLGGLPTFQFTIPRSDPSNACIKLEASIIFQATYPVDVDLTSSVNRTVEFNLVETENFTYSGYCQPDKSMIEILFLNDWRLELYFYKLPTTFLFNHVVLYYKLNGNLFPQSNHDGAQSEVYDLTYVNSTLQKSYSCKHGLRIDLDEVTIYLKNFRVEPYFNKRPNLPFESELTCPADQVALFQSRDGFAWLISVAFFFGFLIVCCVLFVYCKLKTNSSETFRRTNARKTNHNYDSILG